MIPWQFLIRQFPSVTISLQTFSQRHILSRLFLNRQFLMRQFLSPTVSQFLSQDSFPADNYTSGIFSHKHFIMRHFLILVDKKTTFSHFCRQKATFSHFSWLKTTFKYLMLAVIQRHMTPEKRICDFSTFQLRDTEIVIENRHFLILSRFFRCCPCFLIWKIIHPFLFLNQGYL